MRECGIPLGISAIILGVRTSKFNIEPFSTKFVVATCDIVTLLTTLNLWVREATKGD